MHRYREMLRDRARSQTPCTYGNTSRENREIPGRPAADEYETDFLGFSYGFRPGRGQHDGLDALYAGRLTGPVNRVLDVDLRGFFDAVGHGWLVKFVEYRIADRRIVRLIQKWLNAGVLEEGKRTHICATQRSNGRFTVLRQTMRKRLQAKLNAVKTELRRRMHEPVPVLGQGLGAVVGGHIRYYGVPMNSPALHGFAFRWDGCGIARCAGAARTAAFAGIACAACSNGGCLLCAAVIPILYAAVASSPEARAGCGKAARPDPWRGLWVTMIPTPTGWNPARKPLTFSVGACGFGRAWPKFPAHCKPCQRSSV